jgi:chromosome partitioning protein
VAIVVAFVSQKGGVGKSTLARALGAVAAHAGLNVTLADLDPRQATSVEWEKQRRANKISPVLRVVPYASASDALTTEGGADLLILDTPAGATAATLEIARRSHLVVQPTGPSRDDLYPAVLLFHELVQAGIPRARLVFALCRVLDSAEQKAARAYCEEAGYNVLLGALAERAAYRVALNRGHALTETKECDLDAQADALIEALLACVGEQVEPRDQIAERAILKKGSAA